MGKNEQLTLSKPLWKKVRPLYSMAIGWFFLSSKDCWKSSIAAT